MKIIRFDHLEEMEQAARALLVEHFRLADPGPHAVMLTGGSTPQGLYRSLTAAPDSADDRLHILISDERHVPLDSPANNFATMRPMIRAWGIDDSRVLRVHTEMPLTEAADRYDAELASFFKQGGRITLGILGLGADGHAASLFNANDLNRGKERFAIAVPRKEGPDRVSVTPDLLAKVERVIFLVAGPEKAAIVQKISSDPNAVVAVQAVQSVSQLELWYAPMQGTGES